MKAKQTELFAPNKGTNGCTIVPVGKRRDGGTRYWCLSHKADATAKYGKPASTCRSAHLPPVLPEQILNLDLDRYPGGIALWGAVPPIYDTTCLPLDFGIHVHARKIAGGEKLIDGTFRAVNLMGGQMPPNGLLISETDAVYFMVSSVFEFDVREVRCTYCDHSHLDKDWFSIHPHRRHLCAGCGKNFRDNVIGIGNPIRAIQEASGLLPKRPTPATKKLSIRQQDYPGGIQIWGSNPAIIWSSERNEESGIHIHAYSRHGVLASPDDTFSEVEIDGVKLDPVMVRTLMAQSSLPHLEGRVVPLKCDHCSHLEFCTGPHAFTAATDRLCSKCNGHLTGPTRLRRTIGNPLLYTLAMLAKGAPRQPQRHVTGLLPETL